MTWILLTACTGEPEPQDTQPVVDDPCTADTECDVWKICDDAGECVVGDRSDAPEDAQSLLWDTPEPGYLQSPDDADYFSFETQGQEWVRLQTTSEDNDTLLSLYTPEGKLHAREDNHPLGSVSTYDSVLIAYLPTAGTWTLRVTDVEGLGVPSTAGRYTVEVTGFSAVTQESDDLDEPSLSIQLDSGSINNMGVLLETEGDEDWIELLLPTDPSPALFIGPQDARETTLTPLVELYLPDGTPLLSKLEPGPNGSGVHLGIEGGRALMRVVDVDGQGGPNAWTTVHSRMIDWQALYTQDAGDNDDWGDAQELPVTEDQDDEGRARGTSRAWGWLDDSDEDWFAVEVVDGNSFYINGVASSAGSLLEPLVEVYDSTGELLTTGVPDADNFPDVPYTDALEGGTYYVRVFTEQNDGGPGYYYYWAAYQKAL